MTKEIKLIISGIAVAAAVGYIWHSKKKEVPILGRSMDKGPYHLPNLPEMIKTPVNKDVHEVAAAIPAQNSVAKVVTPAGDEIKVDAPAKLNTGTSMGIVAPKEGDPVLEGVWY